MSINDMRWGVAGPGPSSKSAIRRSGREIRPVAR